MSQLLRAAHYFKSQSFDRDRGETPAIVFFAMVIGATFFI